MRVAFACRRCKERAPGRNFPARGALKVGMDVSSYLAVAPPYDESAAIARIDGSGRAPFRFADRSKLPRPADRVMAHLAGTWRVTTLAGLMSRARVYARRLRGRLDATARVCEMGSLGKA